MSVHQKSTLPVRVKQEKSIASVNKRTVFYLITTVIMLCSALMVSDFKLL